MATFSGSTMRSIRSAAGIRVEALAVAIDKSYDTIKAYESGRIDPPASVVAAIASALDVTPGELFADEIGGAA